MHRPQSASHRYVIIILLEILLIAGAFIVLPQPSARPNLSDSRPAGGRIKLGPPNELSHLYQLLPTDQPSQLQPTPSNLQPAAGRNVYEQFETPQSTHQSPQLGEDTWYYGN